VEKKKKIDRKNKFIVKLLKELIKYEDVKNEWDKNEKKKYVEKGKMK
jgi:hypothetical protein